MEHQDIRHKLSEYLDDAVSAEERSAIESHLAVCGECSDAVRELRKTIEHLRAVEEIEPPAWMAQKIMAKVRETGTQRSRPWPFFDRFVVLRPVRVLALLALTVTAYAVYVNLEPEGPRRERPMETGSREEKGRTMTAPGTGRSKEEAPAGGTMRSEPVMGKTAPASKKALPRSPDYRSLDMKYSYEQPPPPEPAAPPEAGAVGSAFARKKAVRSQAETGASIAAAPQAAAPLAEQSRAMDELAEAKSPAAPQGPVRLTLETAAVASAAARSAKAVTDLGGRVVKIDTVASAHIITADMPTDVLEELVKKLRKLGTLRDLPAYSFPRQERVKLELTVLTPPAGQVPRGE